MNRKDYNHNWYLKPKQWHKDYAKRNRERIIAYRKTHSKEAALAVIEYRHKHGDRRKSQDRKSKLKKQEFFWSLKNKPCLDCGVRYRPVAMDFDHLPEYEKLSINGFTAMSNEHILAEIKKCELVCANCHRIRTWRRRQ